MLSKPPQLPYPILLQKSNIWETNKAFYGFFDCTKYKCYLRNLQEVAFSKNQLYGNDNEALGIVHKSFPVSSEDDDEHEYEDDEKWMENTVPKGPRGPIENEMISLQKEQEGLDEVKRLSEKETCMKVFGKRSACVFSFKSTNRAEELEAENEKLKSEFQEMKATMASVKDMQKMINQLQDFQKCIEGVSPAFTPTDASMD